MVKSRTAGATQALPQKPPRKAKERAPGHATRETVESIAVAVILAFLFRAFVAEAFVIPTGSMAPTLMGQHKDVECPECGYWYQAGASIEIEDEASDQRLLEMGGQPSGTRGRCDDLPDLPAIASCLIWRETRTRRRFRVIAFWSASSSTISPRPNAGT